MERKSRRSGDFEERFDSHSTTSNVDGAGEKVSRRGSTRHRVRSLKSSKFPQQVFVFESLGRKLQGIERASQRAPVSQYTR